MATLDFRAPSDPQNIVAELNLSYRLESTHFQNIDRTATLFVRESVAVAPPAGAAGLSTRSRRILHDASPGNDPIWMWTNSDPAGCQTGAE